MPHCVTPPPLQLPNTSSLPLPWPQAHHILLQLNMGPPPGTHNHNPLWRRQEDLPLPTRPEHRAIPLRSSDGLRLLLLFLLSWSALPRLPQRLNLPPSPTRSAHSISRFPVRLRLSPTYRLYNLHFGKVMQTPPSDVPAHNRLQTPIPAV